MYHITYTATHRITSLIETRSIAVRAASEDHARHAVREDLFSRGYIFITVR